MLTVLRNDEGMIEAAMSWWLVNDTGTYDPAGQYVYVDQLEVSHRGHTRQRLIECIRLIAPLVPDAVGAYWVRRDKTGFKAHGYRREQLMQLALREEVNV